MREKWPRETLRYLKAGSSDNICIVNRSRERAVALSTAFETETESFDNLHQQIVETDLLIGTTSAADPIVDAATFASLNAKRGGRIMLVLDLAVPRDFDPIIGNETGVYLYQIDDLQAACNRNRREREKQWPKAKQILDEEVELFFQTLQQRATGPIIRRLRERAEQVKTEELQRLLSKLNGSTNEAATKKLKSSFDRLTNKAPPPAMGRCVMMPPTGIHVAYSKLCVTCSIWEMIHNRPVLRRLPACDHAQPQAGSLRHFSKANGRAESACYLFKSIRHFQPEFSPCQNN